MKILSSLKLWSRLTSGVDSRVTILNNLAQLGIAQGVANTTLLLCLFSFSNFAGRLGGGVLSEFYVRLVFASCLCDCIVFSWKLPVIDLRGFQIIYTYKGLAKEYREYLLRKCYVNGMPNISINFFIFDSSLIGIWLADQKQC